MLLDVSLLTFGSVRWAQHAARAEETRNEENNRKKNHFLYLGLY